MKGITKTRVYLRELQDQKNVDERFADACERAGVSRAAKSTGLMEKIISRRWTKESGESARPPVFIRAKENERSRSMENKGMTNNQFKGIIKMIIALIRDDTPKDELISYLSELIKE